MLPSLFERQRWQVTDGAVGALFVADRQPVRGCDTCFVQAAKLVKGRDRKCKLSHHR